MKVLVVDDSAIMRKVIGVVLDRIGVTEIVPAESGQWAVDIIVNQDFDLVLLDWNMPDMPGIDVLRQIRASGNKVPLIMMTTETEKAWGIESIKNGADNYIVKPFRPSTLVTMIEKALNVKVCPERFGRLY